MTILVETIPAEKIAIYRRNLRARLSRPLTEKEQADLQLARAEAEDVARRLLDEYSLRRILLFGSVARGWPLRPDSDIDLAVEGMAAEDYYSIAGDLFSSSRAIDLVRLEAIQSSFKRVILEEGVDLIDVS